MSFEVNDSILVQNRENRQLEGIVAYIGPVDFADGDDWVGVRLTGSSVGLGKNDGSVQGKKYFESPPQCGLFVKKSAIEKRQLNRLEMLRLRRELASSAGADTTTVPSTPGASRTPARRSATDAAAAATPSAAATTSKTPPSAKSTVPTTKTSAAATRLEEIRQRRAQLQGGSASGATTVGLSAASSTESLTGVSEKQNSTLQKQVEELTAQLASKNKEVEALQNDAVKANENMEKNEKKMEALQKELEQAKSCAAEQVPARSQEDEAHEILKLQTQVDQLEKRLSDEQKAFKETNNELQTKLQQSEVALAAAQAQVEGLNQELSARDEQQEQEQQQSSQQRSNDASHYKERAKLQAEVASLNRRVEQLELDKQELENTVEELALDKEQLEEIKEGLEDRLDELKLDQETAQMELEETKMELEDTRTKLEAMEEASTRTTTAAGVASTGAVLSVAGSGPGEGMEEQQAQADLAQNLSIQNARLREALIRLREQSSMEKMELTRQMRTLEKQAEEAKTLSAEVETLRESRKDFEEQISDLKDMVEQGSAYEIMVEDLSDRVLSLEEELNAALQTIREMEEAADITAEMEEVQTEELKALNREMEDRETVIRNLEEAIKMCVANCSGYLSFLCSLESCFLIFSCSQIRLGNANEKRISNAQLPTIVPCSRV
jgi:dynactin 1